MTTSQKNQIAKAAVATGHRPSFYNAGTLVNPSTGSVITPVGTNRTIIGGVTTFGFSAAIKKIRG